MFPFFKPFLLCMIFMFSVITPATVSAKPLQSLIDEYCSKSCVSAVTLADVSKRVSDAYGLDMRAVLAIIHVESKYNTKAKNGSSVGLSQVLLRFHKSKFIGKNYYDVDDNVFAGMQVLRACLKRTKGNYPKAFRCYNGGGDPNYKFKASMAYRMMKNVKLPETTHDPLGNFINKHL